jgi:hypothetical protein
MLHSSGHSVKTLCLALALCAAGCGAGQPDEGSPEDQQGGVFALTGTPKRVTHIPFQGGQVLHHPRAFHLYWGSYFAKTAAGKHEVAVLDAFAQNAGTSNWWGITQEYPDGQGPIATSSVKGGSLVVGQDPGASVTDLDIRNFIFAQINAGAVRWDPQGIYFVFTPPGVLVHGGKRGGGTSCNQVCGYHHFIHTAALKGQGEQDLLYSSIPHGDCPDGCSVKGLHVNTPALDQATVTLSHELAETATDPFLTGWTTAKGKGDNELGDLCNGGAQVTWGGQPFAVQDLWSNAGRHCAHSK